MKKYLLLALFFSGTAFSGSQDVTGIQTCAPVEPDDYLMFPFDS